MACDYSIVTSKQQELQQTLPVSVLWATVYSYLANDLLLQYNVNNHISDGVHYLWWPSVLLGNESVCIE